MKKQILFLGTLFFAPLALQGACKVQEFFIACQNNDLKKVGDIQFSSYKTGRLSEYSEMINTKDDKEETPLYSVITNHNTVIARHLFSNGAKLNTKNQNGDTPLHWAIKCYNFLMIKDIVEMITQDLQEPSLLNIKNNDGNTPFHLIFLDLPDATLQYIETLAIMLLNAGANPEIPNNNGFKPSQNQRVQIILKTNAMLEKSGMVEKK